MTDDEKRREEFLDRCLLQQEKGKTCLVTGNTCADVECAGNFCLLASTPEGQRALEQGESET